MARIGIDGHVLGKNIGGVERYVEKVVELVPDLAPQHDFTIFVNRQAAPGFAADTRRNVRFVTLPMSDPLVQRSIILPWAVRRHRLDLLQVQRIAPLGCGACRLLLTVHDLIPLKYAAAYPGFRNHLIRALTPGSIRRADFIISPTQSVCDDIARTYPATRAKLRPFYSGVDPARFARRGDAAEAQTLQRLGIDGRYIFSSGAVEARKNLETVIQAMGRLENAPLLLLSGSIRDRKYFNRIQKLAAELGLGDRVRHLGFLSDDELVDIYRCAALCVAASHDEGFNLLPIEAMSCGTPVICSDIPVHRELFSGAAQFFPPDDAAFLASEIANFLEQRIPPHLHAGAAKCVARLSWTAMAGRMAGFFDELARASSTR